MADFTMPSLGADMKTGTLVAWNVKQGDRVKRGDVIADVETDKGIMEIEVFEDGIVESLLVEPGTLVPVGLPIAHISGVEAESAVSAPAPAPSQRLRVSPLARKRATELGVDLQQVEGTGPDGAIQTEDVERAAAALSAGQPAPPKPSMTSPVERSVVTKAPMPASTGDFQTGMRRAIAAAMALANRDIPHYYLETRIDMSRPLQWLERENQKRSLRERILPVVLLIKATALALTDVPELNGYWIDDHLQVEEAIHIGFTISLRQGGLVTPAIHHADLKTLDELMAAMRDLIERTRGGRLRSSELMDATITLTNLGDIGVEKVFGVIYPPQVALIGFGKIAEQPWAEGGMVGPRPVLTATLAGDHRATDGLVGARFLQALTTRLQTVQNLS